MRFTTARSSRRGSQLRRAWCAERWVRRQLARGCGGLDCTTAALTDAAAPPPPRGCKQAALRAWWKDCFDRLVLRYEKRSVTTAPLRAVLEYHRYCEGEPTLAVAEVFELRAEAGGGLTIHQSRVYHG